MKQSETITKRTAIYGAGQAGAMALTWLPANYTAVCFIDSAPWKQGTLLGGLPVVSLEDALEKELDEILIAVLNREASAQIRENLRQAGFAGEVTEIITFRDHLEINRLFPDRTLYLFDTFAGFDPADVSAEDERTAGDPHAGGRNFSDTGVELVRSVLPHPEKAVFVAGHFPESVAAYAAVPGAAGAAAQELIETDQEVSEADQKDLNPAQATYALVSLDPDLYRPAADGLRFFWDRLSIGGVILIHDYTSFQYPGIRRAVDEFCDREGLTVIPLPDLHGTAILLKQE